MNALADRASLGSGLRSWEIVGGDLHLVLNNTIAAVDDGRRQILQYLEPQALSAKVINRLEVIFEELVSNIVRHGFRPRSDQSILVLATSRSGAIELTFEDDGAPFNPLEVPESEPFKSLETAKLGGLGIPLVLRLSASVSYERMPPGGPRRDLGDRVFEPCNRLRVSIATDS
jgi:anti-sigma regulatory factor (Ser/Thr protein kinase)